MIKLGSRTELIIPKEAGLEILISIGQKVKAGTTVLAQYSLTCEMAPSAGAAEERS
jgi:phosphatidylserine decarboxylase